MQIKGYITYLMALLIALTAISAPASAHELDVLKRRKKKKKENTEQKEYNSVITTYPVSFVASTLQIGFEHKVTERFGLCGIAGYTSVENSDLYWAEQLEGYTLELQPRFYITRNSSALKGIFAAPFVTYRNLTFIPRSLVAASEMNISAIKVGYVFGYQKVFNSGFSMSVFAGGGVNSPEGPAGEFDDPFIQFQRGILPHLGFAIGIAL